MITQLTLLEQAIGELKERYHITATELVNLKKQLSQDDSAQKINSLQEQLARANDELASLTYENTQRQLRIDELYEQNQALLAQNQTLTEKNTLAISHAQTIQEWLAKIDRVD